MGNSTSERAAQYLREVADMLIEKGLAYGDSIGDPVRIFSKSSQDEGLRVRIDDKLSRIAKGDPTKNNGEDQYGDLIGYLALLKVSPKPKGPDGIVCRCGLKDCACVKNKVNCNTCLTGRYAP